LQIDVDIGSSSVARSIIGLVLGYVTSIVVDLAILVEVWSYKSDFETPFFYFCFPQFAHIVDGRFQQMNNPQISMALRAILFI
jgi:hypothetical protein